MSQDDAGPSGYLEAGSQSDAKQRAVAIAVTLALEAMLLLALLALGQAADKTTAPLSSLVSFDAEEDAPDNQPDVEPSQPALPQFAQAPTPPPDLAPEVPEAPAVTSPPPAAIIPVSPEQMRSADISQMAPARPAAPKQVYGPVDTGTPGDSQRISGSGPNGEPLYAAAWYREPTRQELAGYLSTADSPSWALVNCQTAPNYRVEKCFLEQEYPKGSRIGRAVLAATWQFKVRPPRVGGRSKVGEWVRIRIDYNMRRRPN